MKKLFLLPFLFFSIIYSDLIAQTNLELLYKLINQSVQKIDSVINKKESKIKLMIFSSSSLEPLKPYIAKSFSEYGYDSIFVEKEPNLLYILTDANVKYQNIFETKLFGDNYLRRNVQLKGSVLLLNESVNVPYNFSINYIDTIKYDDVNLIENKKFPFTQGEIPEPPILKNLLQPAIVVGTLITAVILFFTIRSK